MKGREAAGKGKGRGREAAGKGKGEGKRDNGMNLLGKLCHSS